MLLGTLLRALAVPTLATAAAGVLLRLLRPPLHYRWFRVGPGERRRHRRAGVAGCRHTRLSEASHLLGGAAALLVLGVDARGVALAVTGDEGQPARDAIAAASATSASSTVRTAGRAAALGRSTASTSRAARTPASGRRTRRRPPRSSVE